MLPKYICLDVETTGLNPQLNPLIQIAFAVLDEDLKEVDSYVSDVRPLTKDYEYTEESLEVTGFTLDRINDAPEAKTVAQEVVSKLQSHFVTQSPCYIGQFYCFDFAVLNKFFNDTDLIQEWLPLSNNEIIDTKSIVLTANLKAKVNNTEKPYPVTSLNKPHGLKDRFGIKDKYQAHDALGDVRSTVEVLKNLIK